MSLHCKLVPVQYGEYEYGLIFTIKQDIYWADLKLDLKRQVLFRKL